METIKYEQDGKEKEVKLKNPTGRQVEKGYNMFVSLRKLEDENQMIEDLNTFQNYVDKITCECVGLTEEQLNDLDCDVKDKITLYYYQKIIKKLDFLKSLSKLENSVPKDTQA